MGVLSRRSVLPYPTPEGRAGRRAGVPKVKDGMREGRVLVDGVGRGAKASAAVGRGRWRRMIVLKLESLWRPGRCGLGMNGEADVGWRFVRRRLRQTRRVPSFVRRGPMDREGPASVGKNGKGVGECGWGGGRPTGRRRRPSRAGFGGRSIRSGRGRRGRSVVVAVGRPAAALDLSVFVLADFTPAKHFSGVQRRNIGRQSVVVAIVAKACHQPKCGRDQDAQNQCTEHGSHDRIGRNKCEGERGAIGHGDEQRAGGGGEGRVGRGGVESTTPPF